MRFVVIVFLVLIVASLGSALVLLLRSQGEGGTRVARALAIRLPQARRMAYCLHKMGVLEQEGVRARQRVWRRCPPYVVPLGHPVLPRGTDGVPASP